METVLDELYRYVRFDERDRLLLQAFRAEAEPHFSRISSLFYARIREHEDAHAVIVDEAQIKRLHDSLVRWMGRVLGGPWDDEYRKQTARIGQVHVRIGLPQRYMFSGMSLIRNELLALATAPGHEPDLATALNRALDVELGIMLEAYREHLFLRIEELHRRERDAATRAGAVNHVLAVELARMLIIGLDDAGRVRLFNREAEDVTGFGRDEVIGEPFVMLFDGVAEDADRAGRLSSALARGTGQTPMVERIRTRSGRVRTVQFDVARATEAADVAVFVVGQDVTERTELEERVRRSERLASIGTLAAGLAHEIRNPLNGAQLHLTFLSRSLRKAGNQELTDALQVVEQELRRLSSLVTEFLDFARPRPLAKRRCPAADLVHRVTQLLEPQARASGIQLHLDMPAVPVEVDVDPARIEQVLLNLTLNAIEALEGRGTPGGNVTLRVLRRPSKVLFEIEDDGPGIPTSDAPIFDPFYSTKPSGTGLGLAIAHRIANDHGGSLDFESRPGRTLFRLGVLPYASSDRGSSSPGR